MKKYILQNSDNFCLKEPNKDQQIPTNSREGGKAISYNKDRGRITVTQGIFEANSGFRVKSRKAGKV